MIRLNDQRTGKSCRSLRARKRYDQDGGQCGKHIILDDDCWPLASLRVTWNGRESHSPDLTFFHPWGSLGPTLPLVQALGRLQVATRSTHPEVQAEYQSLDS